jgi:hypothetical protein
LEVSGKAQFAAVRHQDNGNDCLDRFVGYGSKPDLKPPPLRPSLPDPDYLHSRI